jgi:hypothetical protein
LTPRADRPYDRAGIVIFHTQREDSMTRVTHIVVACALLLAVGAVPAFSDQACKPVVGHFEAVRVLPGEDHCPSTAPFCTAGRVWGGIQGDYQFVMTNVTPSVLMGGTPSIVFFTGKSTIFLKSGDNLAGTDTGAIDSVLGGFASLITFDGGTGAMAGATGQIRLRGELAEGTTSGDYVGTLCTP